MPNGNAPWGDEPTATRRIRGRRTHGERVERAEALRSLLDGTAVVYAVRLADGVIKVGWTEAFAERQRWLGSMYGEAGEAEILAFRPGSRDEEAMIHQQLRAHRAFGYEYYYSTPEVLAVVNDMREHCGLPPLAA